MTHSDNILLRLKEISACIEEKNRITDALGEEVRAYLDEEMPVRADREHPVECEVRAWYHDGGPVNVLKFGAWLTGYRTAIGSDIRSVSVSPILKRKTHDGGIGDMDLVLRDNYLLGTLSGTEVKAGDLTLKCDPEGRCRVFSV